MLRFQALLFRVIAPTQGQIWGSGLMPWGTFTVPEFLIGAFGAFVQLIRGFILLGGTLLSRMSPVFFLSYSAGSFSLERLEFKGPKP